MLTGTPLGAIITDAKIGVNIEGGGTPLAPGSRITLINSNSGVTGSPANTSGTAMKGITILYDYHLSQDADNLYVDLGSVYINPQTKSLIDGNLARFIGPLNGADLLVGKGINSALSAAESCEFRKHSSNAAENQPAPVNSTLNADSGWSVFVVSLGGASRYGTGSHIDVTGLSMLTGVAKRFDSGKSDKLLAGVFFEAGWGDYDAHNSFSRMSSVNGDGTTSYYGGGILGRYDLDFGLYFDASARMGAVLGNYNSKDLHDGLGKRAEYDMTTLYYGLHLGAGYLWNISDCARLDVSSKFIWTHQSPDHATIANDRVKFEAIDSLRWRSGARLSYGATSSFAPYVGVYYDHEFDGQAKGSVYAFGIPSTALEGGTGVGEIGVAFNPTGTDTFSVDLGVQGYTGVREGVTGSVQLKWDF